MKGAKDLIESERGIFCILVLIAATILAIVKVITGEVWGALVKWIALSLVMSKTATGALDQWLKPEAVQPPTASS